MRLAHFRWRTFLLALLILSQQKLETLFDVRWHGEDLLSCSFGVPGGADNKRYSDVELL